MSNLTFCAHCGGMTETRPVSDSPQMECSCGFTAAGRQRIAELEQQLGQWRECAENLAQSGHHDSGCDTLLHDPPLPCDCGFGLSLFEFNMLEEVFE